MYFLKHQPVDSFPNFGLQAGKPIDGRVFAGFFFVILTVLLG